jgi:hypothetical protein
MVASVRMLPAPSTKELGTLPQPGNGHSMTPAKVTGLVASTKISLLGIFDMEIDRRYV